jgi:hypothetical protein
MQGKWVLLPQPSAAHAFGELAGFFAGGCYRWMKRPQWQFLAGPQNSTDLRCLAISL